MTGMVAAVDSLAAQAGVDALRAGGTAADAAIATNAVLTVTFPHQCGLGGDLWALVHAGGETFALCGAGRAGSGADPERARREDLTELPRTGDVRAVTVPGCVDGWLALHERFGRLPLSDLLAPARALAENGFAPSPTLRAMAADVAGVPGAEELTAARARRPGADRALVGRVVRPGMARTLAAIAHDGRDGFYGGEFGAGLLAVGAGEFAADDLVRRQADWRPALSLAAWGRRLWTAPPPSQGYLTLASAWLAERGRLPAGAGQGKPEGADALLVDAARAAAADRDRVLHERADGAALLDPERLAALRPGTAPTRAGDTVALCTVDGEGMGVSLLQSNFSGGWGSRIVVPETGIFLHDRGCGFSLEAGHPAEYGPGRRPPHTLSPTLVTSEDGALELVLGTMGGESQPQILLQLLSGLLVDGQGPEATVAAPRWILEGDTVVHEGRDRPAGDPAFGHAQIVTAGLEGAADPRSGSGAALRA